MQHYTHIIVSIIIIIIITIKNIFTHGKIISDIIYTISRKRNININMVTKITDIRITTQDTALHDCRVEIRYSIKFRLKLRQIMNFPNIFWKIIP